VVEGLVGVEQWAELRREHFVRGVSIRDLVRRSGLSRNTTRAALRAPAPPSYRREPTGSELDPFKDESHVLLRREPELTGQRIRGLIAPLGFDGGKTIVDDYLREMRPFFVDARTCAGPPSPESAALAAQEVISLRPPDERGRRKGGPQAQAGTGSPVTGGKRGTTATGSSPSSGSGTKR
jgi:hypothetical protein